MKSSEVKEIRKGAGLTQSALAAILGVNPRTIRRWEAGESKPPKSAIICIVEYCEAQ